MGTEIVRSAADQLTHLIEDGEHDQHPEQQSRPGERRQAPARNVACRPAAGDRGAADPRGRLLGENDLWPFLPQNGRSTPSARFAAYFLPGPLPVSTRH
jgi:hypothetical protein